MYLIIWKALGLVFVYLMLLIILRALQVLIIDLGGLNSWRNSFKADAQHSDNLAGTPFQCGDVNMDFSSDKPKQS